MRNGEYCQQKRDECMINRSITCLILAFFVVPVTFAGNSFAADRTKQLELSTAIGKARLFAQLTDEEKAALKVAATLRHCQEGERIIEQGESLDRMFIVLKGQAGVRVNGKLVATLPEQSLLGELEFLDMLPASADVTLLKESYVIELNNASLKGLMNRQPRLGYVHMSEIARVEAQRLRAMDQK
jgi:signal-transduction protein with cAMP-binding, CBS, and nucleotidyltransferase domain